MQYLEPLQLLREKYIVFIKYGLRKVSQSSTI